MFCLIIVFDEHDLFWEWRKHCIRVKYRNMCKNFQSGSNQNKLGKKIKVWCFDFVFSWYSACLPPTTNICRCCFLYVSLERKRTLNTFLKHPALNLFSKFINVNHWDEHQTIVSLLVIQIPYKSAIAPHPTVSHERVNLFILFAEHLYLRVQI